MNGVVTILFTDLVGSTELFGRLGESRADALRRDHFAMLRAALAAQGGNEVKSIGDSIMAAFTSPARAVACGIEMQQRVHSGGRGGVPVLALRVGINAGEATVEDGDYFGTPVVVARRLCDSAKGGEILVSDVVRGLIGSRGGFSFKGLGPLPLKGIDDPVAASSVSWEPFTVGTPLPAAIATDQTLLVGRDRERATLRQAFERARDGGPGLILIAGEPGIGKTSLAFDFARDAHSSGVTVLYGRCDEEFLIPYQPFAEALQHLADHLSESAPGAGAMPSTPLPGSAATPLSAHADAESERYRMFEAVREIVDARSPLIVLLDDLHWADKPTLMLLRHLVRSAESAPFIIGTYRDVELDRTHPFAEALGDLRREGTVERILLRGLSEQEVVDYVERRTGQSLDHAGRTLAAALHQETEGNPFFIREILRHLTEVGAISEREGRWSLDRPIEEVGLPEGVREVIGRRLSRLSDTCGEALSVASVVGRDFDLAVVARVTGVDQDSLADLLDEAVRARGVIDEASGQLDRYTFAHALVREALYEELSTNRRVRLHRRVGEAIEEVFASELDPHLSELAYHFYEAAVGGAEAKAIDYARRAGKRAIDQLAYEEADAHFDRALHLLEGLDAPDSAVLCETLISAAEAHQVMTDISAARKYATRAAEIARSEGWAESLARAALAYGGLWIDIGLVQDELVAMLREATAGLPPDHPLVPLLEGRLAMDMFSGDPEELEIHSRRAVELARRGDDPGILAYALVARRHAVSGPARLDERLSLSTEAMKLAREVGDAYLEMRARAFRIVELVEAGDFDVADRDYQEFFRLADEYRQPFYQQYLSRFFGVGIALREGRFDEADEILTAVMELARRQGRVTAIVATAGQRIWLEYMRGRPENVDQTSADVTLGFLSSVPWGLAGAAATLWTLGRQEEARAAWDGMTLEDLQALGDNWVTLITLWAGSEMSYLLGDRRLASEIYERARPFAGRLIGLAGTALVYVADSFDEVLGKTSELLGRLDEAASHYQAAIDLYGRWRMRPFRAISRMRLARVLTQGTADERKRARPLLDEALSEADEIGLGHPFVAEARGLRAEL